MAVGLSGAVFVGLYERKPKRLCCLYSLIDLCCCLVVNTEEVACLDSLMEGSSAGLAVKFSPWFCAALTGVQCEHEWAERSPGALQYSPVQWRRCDCQSEPLVVC